MSQMTVVNQCHIELDDQGRAWIRGENRKVLDVVQEHVGWGWTAEDIYREHPDLPLPKIYGALAYYYDHKSELDAEMERELKMVDEMRAAAGPSPLAEKWRARTQA